MVVCLVCLGWVFCFHFFDQISTWGLSTDLASKENTLALKQQSHCHFLFAIIRLKLCYDSHLHAVQSSSDICKAFHSAFILPGTHGL